MQKDKSGEDTPPPYRPVNPGDACRVECNGQDEHGKGVERQAVGFVDVSANIVSTCHLTPGEGATGKEQVGIEIEVEIKGVAAEDEQVDREGKERLLPARGLGEFAEFGTVIFIHSFHLPCIIKTSLDEGTNAQGNFPGKCTQTALHALTQADLAKSSKVESKKEFP